MDAKKLPSGIFIDSGCHGIIQMCAGYFIPETASTNLSEEAYQADLNAFLKKWFPRDCGLHGIKDLPEATTRNPG